MALSLPRSFDIHHKCIKWYAALLHVCDITVPESSVLPKLEALVKQGVVSFLEPYLENKFEYIKWDV